MNKFCEKMKSMVLEPGILIFCDIGLKLLQAYIFKLFVTLCRSNFLPTIASVENFKSTLHACNLHLVFVGVFFNMKY